MSAEMMAIARDPRAIAAAVLAAIVAGVAVGLDAGDPGAGVFVGIATLAYAAFVAWGISRSRARGALFSAYAARHGLSQGGRGPMPAATNILRGDRMPGSALPPSNVMERAVGGSLPGRIDGILADYRWSEGSGSSSTEMKTTVVLTAVPEAAGLVRRVFFRALNLSAPHTEKVAVESAALADPYTLMIGREDDPNRARQLFAPTFLHWLERLPQDFSFEFDHGYLVCARRSQAQTAQELDWLCATTAKVAEHFRSEALESPPTGNVPAVSLDPVRALTPPHLDGARDWARLELGGWVVVYFVALALMIAVL